jgi:DNA-binding transcriptional LysR family regulator
MHCDLTDLRLFLHVAEAGSITGGAKRAHMALASASERIRGMEDQAGVLLLNRGRRGVQPTPAGLAVLHHARAVLHQIVRMQGDLHAYAEGLKGHVRLLCNSAALSEFLPEALGAFLSAHPDVDVDLEEHPSHEIVRAISGGTADVGIAADSIDIGKLESFPFRHDRLVLVAAPDHPLATKESVSFADLLEHDFVGLVESSALQAHLDMHAARLGRQLSCRARLSSFDAVCRVVERRIGVGVVPETAARRCQQSMAIRSVPLADAWASRELKICVRSFENLPSYSKKLIEGIRAH